MSPTRIYVLIFVVTALFAALALAVRFLDDGKKKELLGAPGLRLRFSGGTLLGQSAPGTSILGAGTSTIAHYGTDATEAEIISFFDAELGKLGYQPVPLPPEPGGSGGERLIHQYRQGPFTYSLYLRPLPFRYGSRVISSGYQHILATKLSNMKP